MTKLHAPAVEPTAQDADGHELPDPRPLVMPSGFRRPETLAEQVQRLVRTHISRQAQEQGEESFEEAEDFDIDDDQAEPNTPYEATFDPVLGREVTPLEMQRYEAHYRRRYMRDTAARHAAADLKDRLAKGTAQKPEAPTAKPEAAKE